MSNTKRPFLSSIMQPDWAYRYLSKPWTRLGDSFLLVAPRQTILFTSSAPAIAQITSRREAFPKQTTNYRVLEIFGRNMLSSEGAEWKMHRKGVSASFNERNAAYIFRESIMQTQGMIEYWLGGAEEGEEDKKGGGGSKAASGTVETLEHDTMTLALNIIAHVGFGLRLLWPGQRMPEDADERSRKYGDRKPSEGHSMTFAESLATVLERIFLCLLVPKGLLAILPFQAAREASAARWNYEQYMQEFLRDKKAAAESEDENGTQGDNGMDIMGQLVKAKYGKQKKKTVSDGGGGGGLQQLSDEDIIGNCFIILVAGHETTANTLHFTMIELATNPAAQRALQADIDRLLGRDSDPRGWSYDESINALMASHVAACMNEVLRLTPSVVDIPKEVQATADQSLVLDGERHMLPKGMTIVLNTVGAHRNPKYWPSKDKDGEASDLDEYLPERWFRPSLTAGKTDAAAVEEEEEDYGGFKGPDTSAQLYRPVRGSFIPFSDGPRSCLGRRIAQVEMVAALAVLFQRYSVELAVDEAEDVVERLGDEEKRELYNRARTKSRETMRKATSLLTLKLHGDLKVPIRLVKRGEEKFLGLIDV